MTYPPRWDDSIYSQIPIVVSAKAGIQDTRLTPWMAAFADMTACGWSNRPIQDPETEFRGKAIPAVSCGECKNLRQAQGRQSPSISEADIPGKTVLTASSGDGERAPWRIAGNL
jgi:hypothetical protein